ncbi:MarR family winged helix-turn-helix transcriptional regulator [Amorphoplanes digitatis]|uniref:DNA-binding MarR family transcriptional regulator n=1 Tax=Actinoplanes digitatis TaxID=1868 RepID=A0A7W7MU16_9ACTN|nr:MarR family transcriptional regulator [Actinoplanes digitatis]MBB4766084.1 DNA-binding MarR family transcriptional regulator [Actinoplanes digitatis]GID97935.1 MarR family transcriptional regulator [Actinoplanes digitatis]
MAEHHGPAEPDPMRAAAVDDAAPALLAAWDAARERMTPRLSSSQLNALLVIEREPGVNLRGLAAELKMILSSASRLCDRLVASGMVERVPGRADRREIALYLTPSSRELLERLRATRRDLLAEVLERMTPAGRAALVRGLTEFAAAADPPAAARTA